MDAAVAGMPRRMEKAEAGVDFHRMDAAVAGAPWWVEEAMADSSSRGGWETGNLAKAIAERCPA